VSLISTRGELAGSALDISPDISSDLSSDFTLKMLDDLNSTNNPSMHITH
jgi:hypothetical protein